MFVEWRVLMPILLDPAEIVPFEELLMPRWSVRMHLSGCL